MVKIASIKYPTRQKFVTGNDVWSVRIGRSLQVENEFTEKRKNYYCCSAISSKMLNVMFRKMYVDWLGRGDVLRFINSGVYQMKFH